jgi:ribosomal protein S18 acetylase RimI-like enzyme
MSDTAELAIQQYAAGGLREHKAALLAIFTEVYAERLDNPFFTPERFWHRLEGYASQAGFCLVTGTQGDTLVGYTLGFTLPENSGWWRGFRGDAAAELLHENGTRTFAINELMVRPEWRRQGCAKALSTALLAGRSEERATLLVRAENEPAYTAYVAWGFRSIGQVQPFEDAPVYEAMMRELKNGQ